MSLLASAGGSALHQEAKKLLDLLGGGALTLSELPAADEDWYANLLWLDRQKCLLLTHAGTLFSVFLPRCACGRSPSDWPLRGRGN